MRLFGGAMDRVSNMMDTADMGDDMPISQDDLQGASKAPSQGREHATSPCA